MDCSGVALGLDMDNSFGQLIWQNLPSMVHLDLLSSKSSPQFPEMLLSPLFQDSHSKAFLLSSPEPLLTLLSLNRNSPGTPGGAPQMCFMPTLEDKGQDGAEPSHNLTQHGGSTRDCQVDTKEQAPHCSRKNNALNQTLVSTMEELKEGLMIQSLWHLSQHVSLANRASHLQQRVLAILGGHASRHYSYQLDGLKKKLLEARRSPQSTSKPLFETFNAVEMQEVEKALIRNLQYPEAHGQPLKSRDLQNLAHSGHAVLHGVLEALDSDATVSSSDEEWDHEDAKETSVESQCRVCEWRWLKDRAEFCSRWTWLQMRLSELDSQIQQLGKLRQQILSNKGHVVLAESQPLTDRQIQHTLWTETMDLSFTAGNMQDLQSDLEMEPSSPTSLLRNIERQSAQLTQIVNSLMPSLCASPSSSPMSKGPCNHWRGQQKTAYSSQATHTGVFVPSGPQCLHKARQKRKRTCHKRQYLPQVDVSCVSARTRPLLTYHKPRLFVMDPLSHREQVLESPPSLCPNCALCDPASVCTDPARLHRKDRTDGKVHPILSLSSETPSSFHLQNFVLEESLLPRSLLETERTSPHLCLSSRDRVSRSLFHCSHQPKNRRHLKRHRRESTPIRWARTRDHHSQDYREGKKKRRCSGRTVDISSITPKSDLASQSDDSQVEESSEDVTVSYCTPTRLRNLQFSSRRRNPESIFSIDDIVVPMSLFASVKVERLQYKNILTPSWRKVHISPLLKREEDEQEEGMPEAIGDEDFFQRHQNYERREKLRWNKNRRHRIRSSRKSCSSVSARDHPARCHPPIHSPVPFTWTFSTSEDSSEASVDEKEPMQPWRRRSFPLTDEDLRRDEDKSVL
ncbi:KAT8 regulatory NSL complex subunit 1-like protein [Carassius auratus]|uniref:KAT8 regulatory NSL complex subunit 1-like protein n=1 Tax=Carassius auratus TaxID=7957 RepID=A0A6P6Q2J2_CARAU|nr:KAT8 regulatory NSL complex subunit 1-like protein [Carassius auratus]XP_026127258.1 KAT8 regulatory NSL complex subunit 1-like protein [Carassius auratus]XP_026127259.1 KAT8 regulatory NSL complex subunit 1-like protein [Carassius auratus]